MMLCLFSADCSPSINPSVEALGWSPFFQGGNRENGTDRAPHEHGQNPTMEQTVDSVDVSMPLDRRNKKHKKKNLQAAFQGQKSMRDSCKLDCREVTRV